MSQLLYSSLASDPDLAELVEIFVESLPERVESLRQAFEQGDWETLRRTAHQLKGAAGSYGFDPLSPSAAQLEQSVASGPEQDVEAIRQALEELLDLCSRVRAGTPQQQGHQQEAAGWL